MISHPTFSRVSFFNNTQKKQHRPMLSHTLMDRKYSSAAQESASKKVPCKTKINTKGSRRKRQAERILREEDERIKRTLTQLERLSKPDFLSTIPFIIGSSFLSSLSLPVILTSEAGVSVSSVKGGLKKGSATATSFNKFKTTTTNSTQTQNCSQTVIPHSEKYLNTLTDASLYNNNVKMPGAWVSSFIVHHHAQDEPELSATKIKSFEEKCTSTLEIINVAMEITSAKSPLLTTGEQILDDMSSIPVATPTYATYTLPQSETLMVDIPIANNPVIPTRLESEESDDELDEEDDLVRITLLDLEEGDDEIGLKTKNTHDGWELVE
jgi:hypothetical protein